MPVAQAFSDTFAFRSVRGTAGNVNFLNTDDWAPPYTENHLLPYPVDNYRVYYQSGRRIGRSAYIPPPGLIDRAMEAGARFRYDLERHIVWHSAPDLFPIIYGR